AEDGIRDRNVTGVQTCALPIWLPSTEPVKEAKTTPTNPAWSAKTEIISSTALPNVAFSSPPIRGPLTIAKLSVARPIKLDKAIRSEERRVGKARRVKGRRTEEQ